MRHREAGKTAYFQLKKVIFNTNSIMFGNTDSRSEAQREGTSDQRIELWPMQIMKGVISTSSIEI